MLDLLSFTWWNCSKSPWSEPAIWCREGFRPKYLSWLKICMTAFWMKTESSFQLCRNCSSILGWGRWENWFGISREMLSLLESRKFQRNIFPTPQCWHCKEFPDITFSMLPQDNLLCTKGVFALLSKNNCPESFAKGFTIGTQVFPSPWPWALYPSLCSSSLQTLGSTHQWTLLLWTIAIVLVLRNF